MAVKWNPLNLSLKPKKKNPPNVAEQAFEEWIATKNSREKLENFLKSAPMPINSPELSEKECEQYIRQVGQAIKHINLLWKNKFLKFGRGYYKQKKLIDIWNIGLIFPRFKFNGVLTEINGNSFDSKIIGHSAIVFVGTHNIFVG